MKILFIAPRYHTNQHFIVRTLKEHGNKVKFFVLYQSITEEYSALQPEVIESSKIYKIIEKIFSRKSKGNFKFKLKYGFPGFLSLYRRIHSFGPDIVIIRELVNFSLLAMLASYMLSIKIIYYSQNPLCSPKKEGRREKVLGWLEKITGKPITRITPVPGDCDNYLPHEHTHYLPFVVDFDFSLADKTYFQNGNINILMVGKCIPRKNHLLLLEAVNNLKEDFPLKLTIIAGGEKDVASNVYIKGLLDYVKENRMESIVEIKDNLSFADIQKEYRRHDIFALPSVNEPFSISVLEAMSHAMPVLCSDTNGAKYCVKDGLSGFILKSNNVNDLTQKLKRMVSSRESLIAMGHTAFETVKNEHSPDKYYSEFTCITNRV